MHTLAIVFPFCLSFFAEIERCVCSLSLLLSLPNCFILLCITLCFEPFRTVSKCRIAVICVLLSYSCFAFALFLYFCFTYLFLLSIALPCCSILFYLLIFSIFSNYRQIRVVGRREEHLFVKTVSQPVTQSVVSVVVCSCYLLLNTKNKHILLVMLLLFVITLHHQH